MQTLEITSAGTIINNDRAQGIGWAISQVIRLPCQLAIEF